MISVIIHAGLANKMFEYAFAKSLSEKGFDVSIDESTFRPVWDFEDILLSEVFKNLTLSKKSYPWSRLVYSKNRLMSLVKSVLVRLPSCKLVYEKTFRFNSNIYNELKSICSVYGVWQSEKYFNQISETIKFEFEFPYFSLEKNITISNEMQECNSIAIHVRKGDDYNHLKETCTVEYYRNAIIKIKETTENPKFYVFTDNISWVKDNLDFIDYTLCDWNNDKKLCYRDMQLMTYAKHNIIANSTYSWWSAWLNDNPNKIVIAPSLWFEKESPLGNAEDLIPDDWIRL